MALFPKCTFQVLLPGGVIIPGRRLEGTLVVDAPEDIPRAEHLDLVFLSKAWVGYGEGKSREVIRRDLFRGRLQVTLPDERMPAGTHRYPFAVDVPPWLPPGLVGNDCAIEHSIEARLDVDWARDPVAKVIPAVEMLPRHGTRTPLLLRSPPSFHESIVLEVSLASSVIAYDEPLSGHIALRSGQAARFDAVDLSFASSFVMTMGLRDRRRGMGRSIRIPASMLRGGEPVAFEFPAHEHVLPTSKCSFIDHEMVLAVSVDIAWATNPTFDVVVDVLPRGSTLDGAGGEGLVGSERLRRLGAAMAEGTGLRQGRPPTLVEGVVGPVAVRVADAPREAKLGIDVDITFPDVELGLVFRAPDVFEAFSTSPLLPEPLRSRYRLRSQAPYARPPVDDATLAAFAATVLSELELGQELRFSDHHVGVHFEIPNDGAERLVQFARAARDKAAAIADAISRLPFPAALSAARPAWEATAVEQGAYLVPTGPSLYGLAFRARVMDGEERTILAALRTVWTAKGPSVRVDVDLQAAPLPKNACAELEGAATPSDRLRAVRAVFPSSRVLGEGRGATLERLEWTPDPRALLSGIEAFVAWVLDARGERRADLPYR